MTPRPLIAALLIALFPLYSSAGTQKSSKKQVPTETYARDPRVQRFADDVATRRDLDATWVRRTLAQAHRLPTVQKLMLPAPRATAKNWAAYRERFIEPVRLTAGQRFWQEHRRWLEQAEADTGVPASLIVGVLGVETLYGRHMGSFRVLDALATLAFDFPAAHPRATDRQTYFRGELEQFLSLSQRTGQDPLQPRGSYAGAMGMPQFMPGSWVRHAVDFDGDGRIDLHRSAADAIGSVAHYFKAHGWKPGLPTHMAVHFDRTRLNLETLLAPDILPTFSAQTLAGLGATLPDDAPAPAPGDLLALIELHNGDPAQGGQPPSYVVGTENFYVVTRYNWSSYYALAVIELGQAVAAAVRGEPAPPSLARQALP